MGLLQGMVDKAYTGTFYVEGERLTSTGKVQHSITLTDYLPAYVKPYSHPQGNLSENGSRTL